MNKYTVCLFAWALDDGFLCEWVEATSPEEAGEQARQDAVDELEDNGVYDDGAYTAEDVDILAVFEGHQRDLS